MTVAASTATISYTEDGVSLAFAAPFRFMASTDLKIERISADGSVAVLAHGSEWTAAGGTTDAGGTVTLAASVAGKTLRITRRTPRLQAVNYDTGDSFPAETQEQALDRAMLIDQEQDTAIGEVTSRALMAPPGETIANLPAAATRAGKFAAFDAVGAPLAATGTGTDAGLRTDLAAATGARLIGTAQGLTVQAAIDALGVAGKCLIVPIGGQSLSIGRAPQVTPADQVPDNLYMPNGGCEWENVTSPAPLSASTLPIVPSNLATMVRHVSPAGKEPLAPGIANQLRQAGYQYVVAFAAGLGGTSISQNMAGGSTLGGVGGPYFANQQSFIYHAVKWARSMGLEPVIAPVLIQGHSDADQLVDGGTAGVETTQAQYLAALTKYKRDMDIACMLALGETWHGTVWVSPLVTGQASIPYTLTGRKAVAAGQLAAVTGGVPGCKFLSSWSQFAPYFTEGDLVHGSGYYFRGYGEVIGAMIAEALTGAGRTVPYMTGKTVISATQVKITWSEAVQISGAVIEATTAGVIAGLEAYTAGGVQIPLLAAAVTGTNEITVTMASTASFSVIRNGLAQETVGAATKMPRTRVSSATPLATAKDGTVLEIFSPAQEI